jgi:hypothetical protein
MAGKVSIKNIITAGLSGKMGDLVFYQLGGKTFARKAPGSYNKIATPQQAPGRERFQKAMEFAKSVIADPLLKAAYQARSKPPRNAYLTAISEYMRGIATGV